MKKNKSEKFYSDKIKKLNKKIKFLEKNKPKKRKINIKQPSPFDKELKIFFDKIKKEKEARPKIPIFKKGRKRKHDVIKIRKGNLEKSQSIIKSLRTFSFLKKGKKPKNEKDLRESYFSVIKLNNNIKKKFGLKNKKQLKKFISGKFTKNQIKKIDKMYKGKRTKNQFKKIYTSKNFVFEEFYKTDLRKKFKDEAYFFKAGLEIFFSFPNSNDIINYGGKQIGVWRITNYPIAQIYFTSYKESYEDFFKVIKMKTEELKSILFFKINYFTVEILDGETNKKVENQFPNKK